MGHRLLGFHKAKGWELEDEDVPSGCVGGRDSVTWSSCAISKGLIDRGCMGPGLIISAFPEKPLGSLCSVNLGRVKLLPALRLPFHAKEVSSYPRESPSHQVFAAHRPAQAFGLVINYRL